jgi:phosphoenolpyruvate carboxylase
MQSARALDFYLDELHQLGGDLSLDDRRVAVSDRLRALAEQSPDHSPHRATEPYRRAIAGMYARLAETARVGVPFQPGADPQSGKTLGRGQSARLIQSRND